MTESARISNVRFTAASRRDVRTGLCGWVSFSLANHQIVVDGVTIRKTLAGEYRLSWPRRLDAVGREHFYLRPADDTARREIERQVLAALGLDRDRKKVRP